MAKNLDELLVRVGAQTDGENAGCLRVALQRRQQMSGEVFSRGEMSIYVQGFIMIMIIMIASTLLMSNTIERMRREKQKAESRKQKAAAAAEEEEQSFRLLP